MRLTIKTLIIYICLILSTQAETRLFQYNGDLPFVEMMLSMMTEMGMIDKIPQYLVNNGYYDYLDLPTESVGRPGFNAPYAYQGQYPGPIAYPQRSYQFSQRCHNEKCDRNNLSRLDGVWVTRHGEILGVKDGRFLWSDGRTKYITGTLNRKLNEFALKVDQSEYVIGYQYMINGNRMQTRDTNGVVRRFVRAPYKQ